LPAAIAALTSGHVIISNSTSGCPGRLLFATAGAGEVADADVADDRAQAKVGIRARAETVSSERCIAISSWCACVASWKRPASEYGTNVTASGGSRNYQRYAWTGGCAEPG